MSDPFDDILTAQKLRRDAVAASIPDADGKPAYTIIDGVVTSLSADGSIDRAKVLAFLHCGHSTEDGIGGKCAENGCNNISCKQCFARARCITCLKPLCLEHVRQLKIHADILNLCAHCLATVKRQRFWRAAGQLVLRPFRRNEPRKET